MSFKTEFAQWDPCRPDPRPPAAVGPSRSTSLGVVGRICDGKDPYASTMSKGTMPPVSIINHVRKFSGLNYSVAEWAEQVRVLGEMYAIEPSPLAEMAALTLEGEAWTTARLETVRGHRTLDDLVRVLENSYGQTTYPGTLRNHFFRRTQLEWEDIPQYANALQVLMEKIYERGESMLGTSPRETILRDQFVVGLRDQYLNRTLQDLVRMNPKLTFQETKREAIERTRNLVTEKMTENVTCRQMGEEQERQKGVKERERMEETEDLREMVKTLQEQLNRLTLEGGTRQPEGRGRRGGQGRQESRCWTCGELGHRAVRCPQRHPMSRYPPLN